MFFPSLRDDFRHYNIRSCHVAPFQVQGLADTTGCVASGRQHRSELRRTFSHNAVQELRGECERPATATALRHLFPARSYQTKELFRLVAQNSEMVAMQGPASKRTSCSVRT